ncbi:MAG: lipid A deacylase LpxR family protein [Bacteroidota bacterium]|nr:lipid A deacylase LpxR family protein [Bacteroidota bacterium]
MKKLLLLLFFSTSLNLSAQSDSAAKQKNQFPSDRYFRFNYDNDFFSATDRYYTQGIYIDLVMPVIRHSPFSKVLIRLNKKADNYYGITLRQDGFTPRSIRYDSLVIGERPYASLFFVTHTLASVNQEKMLKLCTSLDLGVMGPDAKGEEEQKAIHKALDNIQPLGWENQIANDYVINYNARIEKGLIQKTYFDFSLSGEGRLGSMYTDLAAGGLLRVGFLQPYFANLGLTKQKDQRKFQCYVFAKGNIKAVGYNATLQGGVFNRNSIHTLPAKDITRVVATGYLGFVVAYKRLSLEYTKAYISPEFRNGLFHGWGHCVIAVCF